MPRVFIPGLLSLAILTLSSAPGLSEDSRFAGYLVDRSCADYMKTQGLSVDAMRGHKKDCALNENCSKDGYALFSKGNWYQLDSKGNELSRNLLKASSTSEGHFVLVAGSLDKNGQIKVSTLKELAAAP